MTQSYAFIWDVDGTLIDSYAAIVPAVQKFCAEFGVDYSLDYIRNYALLHSVGKLMEDLGSKVGKDPSWLKARYEICNDKAIGGIGPMPHAREVLATLGKLGHSSFIYTHRGVSCQTIMDRLGMTEYFREIVNSVNGFPKKPKPDGILYLLDKYKLDPQRTFYVGDRSLDILSGNNAGIGTILFLAEGNPVLPLGTESRVIHDLREILDII